ncbi:MAG: hypothetical protein AB8B93_00995 [Pseudomonadales bacterium]
MTRTFAIVAAWLAITPLCLLADIDSVSAETTALPLSLSNQSASSAYDPQLELNASSDQVLRGSAVTLMWQVSNAYNCKGSGDWQGSKASQGNETIAGLTRDSTFILRCVTTIGYEETQVQVAVIEQEDVEVSLTTSAQSVKPGASVNLQWRAENASQCTASGDWVGPLPTQGSQTINGIDGDRTFSLSCGTGTSSALASVTVSLDTPKLEWIAPTQDTDGEPLLDLAGYRVYWGTESGNYTDSATIADPDATEWDILAPPGDYYFAISALAGNAEESALSNEIVKTVSAQSNKQVAAHADTGLQQAPSPLQKSLAPTDPATLGTAYATLSPLFRELIGTHAQIHQTPATTHSDAVCSRRNTILERPVALEQLRLARHSALAVGGREHRLGHTPWR